MNHVVATLEEYQDEEGETLRDDKNFKFVSAWEYKGQEATNSVFCKEELKYEAIKIAEKSTSKKTVIWHRNLLM